MSGYDDVLMTAALYCDTRGIAQKRTRTHLGIENEEILSIAVAEILRTVEAELSNMRAVVHRSATFCHSSPTPCVQGNVHSHPSPKLPDYYHNGINAKTEKTDLVYSKLRCN